ncbi:hypothetical protein [Actinomyces viscosus]|uniref:hypothetical protein n=1 Tax=Actinomyces viscosus TaxID=1656 RepID=UPI0028E7D84C|nr:hypothetical protein [Actinomyces viscosus]
MRSTDEVDSESTERQNNIEVWNDLVSPRDLLICLLISAACVVAAVISSAYFGGKPLFWGLGASTVGFTVCCFLVTPKREVTIVDELSADASEGGDR